MNILKVNVFRRDLIKKLIVSLISSLVATGVAFAAPGSGGGTNAAENLVIHQEAIIDGIVTPTPTPEQDDVVTWPIPEPDQVESNLYGLSVKGQPVYVRHYKDLHYAHFSFTGTAEIDVNVSESFQASDVKVSPLNLGIQPAISGNSISFSMDQPRKLIVTIKKSGEQYGRLQRLYLFADPMEIDPPQPDDPDVVNILDYGIDNTGSSVETEIIQQAIDELPANYTLYFPAGTYRTGTIWLKSNMTLYLAGGALVKASDDYRDFPLDHPNDHTNLSGAVNDGINSMPRLVLIDNADNVTIKGRGILDGNGKVVRPQGPLPLSEGGFRGRLVSMRECNNVLVEDVFLRDPFSWNFHFIGCEYVTARNLKLVNDLTLANTDAFDPDASSHVLIENNFARSSDDASTVKCAGYDGIWKPVTDVKIIGNIFMTKKSALKLGTEMRRQPITDVLFEDNDVVFADRALTIYNWRGVDSSNVRYINNRVEEYNVIPQIDGPGWQRLIDFRIKDLEGDSVGTVTDVLLQDNISYVEFPGGSVIQGHSEERKISNVTIDNLVINGEIVRNTSDADMTTNQYVENLVFTPGQ